LNCRDFGQLKISRIFIFLDAYTGMLSPGRGDFTMRSIFLTKLQHSGEIPVLLSEGKPHSGFNIRNIACVLVVIVALGSGGGCEQRSVPSGTTVDLPQLSFVLPVGWQHVPPSSSMRVAQAVIPGPDGGAEMAVFHFGAGQGGDVDANLQRWVGQVEPDAGTAPQRETFESNGLRVTWVEVRGTLKAGQMGMGPASAQPGSRLFGAVIEGDGGPWFFKASGPDTALGPQRDAFVAMLRSARPRG
jgi:hypothetical protein